MDSISGCQFHPELSGTIGLEFLKTFINYKTRYFTY